MFAPYDEEFEALPDDAEEDDEVGTLVTTCTVMLTKVELVELLVACNQSNMENEWRDPLRREWWRR